MSFKIKLILLAILVVVGIVAAMMILWPAKDDGKLASMAVSAVAGNEQKLHRLTEKAFRMAPLPATRCRLDPTQSPPHVGYYCHVFVNDAAKEPITTGKGKYSVGSVIVKQKYFSKLARKTELFTIMRKMESGYDDENGDREYSIVDSAGAEVLSRGRDESCISCHTFYKDTDYVSREYLR